MTMLSEANKERKWTWKPEEIVSENQIAIHKVPYGTSQDQLVPWLHYPAPSSWGQLFSWVVTYTTTGTKTISGVGFTPRMIKITSTLTTWAISIATYYNGTSNCSYYYTGWWVGDASWNIVRSIYLDNAGNVTQATTITPTNDWFTINVTNVNGWAVTIVYECYW